jgi:hypothetical protein
MYAGAREIGGHAIAQVIDVEINDQARGQLIIPSVRWLKRIVIAMALIAVLALPVVFPEGPLAVTTTIATKIRTLPALNVAAIVVEIALGAALAVLTASG